MKKVKNVKRISIFMVFAILISMGPIQQLDAGGGGCSDCWIREVVPAASFTCTVAACTSGSSYSQYYKCAAAGTGESGKCICHSQSQQIATWIDCEESVNWTAWIACALGIAGCLVSGTACALEPTKITCAGAIVTCGAAGAGCPLMDYTECEQTDSQSTYRSVFQSLDGDACEG